MNTSVKSPTSTSTDHEWNKKGEERDQVKQLTIPQVFVSVAEEVEHELSLTLGLARVRSMDASLSAVDMPLEVL